jgi:16S rRNA (uracil1498-N3)-methyltransferase
MASARLFVEAPLALGASLALDSDRAHYVTTVLRQQTGAKLRLFNGRDGEFSGALEQIAKKSARVRIEAHLRPQPPPSQITLMFAPVKRQATDWIVEKATELGVGAIAPVITRRTVTDTVRLERWRAIATEAAEQCERLDVPHCLEPTSLAGALESFDRAAILVFADESGQAKPIAQALAPDHLQRHISVLIGPEGGFDPAEQRALRSLDFVRPVSLGPRILRAETAAVAALAIIEALWGAGSA